MGWFPQRNVNSWNYSRLFNALFSRVEKRKISTEIKWRIHWILIKLSRVLFTARSQSVSPFQINSPPCDTVHLRWFVRYSCALCAATIHVTKHRESVCVNSVQATALHQSQRAIQMEHHLPLLLVLLVFFVRTTRDIHLYVYNKWSSFNYTIQTSPQARPTATKTTTKQGSQKAPPTESHYEIHTIRTQFCKWFPSPLERRPPSVPPSPTTHST